MLSGNGIKPLRALLLLTAEWNSAEAREQAARALESAAGGSAAEHAASIRARRSCDLGKAQLLELCRLWGYRSDAWVAKGNRARKRRAGAVATTLVVATPKPPPLRNAPLRRLLPSLCAPETDTVRAFITAQLQPLVFMSCAALAGPKSRALTYSNGRVCFGSLAVYDSMSRILDGFQHRLNDGASAQRSWAAAAVCSMTASESTAAATSDVVVAGLSLHEEFNPWSSLPATIEPPVAAHLRELDELLHKGHRLLCANSPSRILVDAENTPPDFLVSQDEYRSALVDGSALVSFRVNLCVRYHEHLINICQKTRHIDTPVLCKNSAAHTATGGFKHGRGEREERCPANLLLAELRVTASFECYASACEVLLAAVASYAGSASEAFATRHAWSSDALQLY